jgi:hypothetical protein
MKDCILSLLWPRKDIYSLFSDHGCVKSELRAIDDFATKNLTRVAMVDVMFEQLSSRNDGGLGTFRAMLHSLTNWSHFDPYYFDVLKKLDRTVAQRNIDHLKQLQEIRDDKIRKERERRQDAEVEAQRAKSSLQQLRTEFLELHAGKLRPQERGYALERVLASLAKLSNLEVTDPFRVNGEQIDGAIKFEGEHYIIEAKWEDTSASNEPVYQFVSKVEGKMYGRGLFISVGGFSDNVIRSIVQGKALRTIFIDGEDLVLVVEEQLSFRDMLDRKVKAAQTRGLIYVHPISGQSKLSDS